VARARETHSDALVVLRDGKRVGEWNFTRSREPIEAMSDTKSIVSLAIGRLIDSGKLRSLDQPVCELYPKWKQSGKKAITIRHLLTQRSGLATRRTTEDIYSQRNFVRYALAAPLESLPGEHWVYNNRAMNLLAGVVQRASGE